MDERINNLRYIYENEIIPYYFFKDFRAILANLDNGFDIFDALFFKLCQRNGLQDPWIKQYESKHFQEDELNYILIKCPQPDRAPQCTHMLLMYNNDKRILFTKELTINIFNPSDTNKHMFCYRKGEVGHYVNGEITGDELDLVYKAKQAFKDMKI